MCHVSACEMLLYSCGKNTQHRARLHSSPLYEDNSSAWKCQEGGKEAHRRSSATPNPICHPVIPQPIVLLYPQPFFTATLQIFPPISTPFTLATVFQHSIAQTSYVSEIIS